MKIPIATLICLYAGDAPELFGAAIQSILDQTLPDDVESRVYLGIDGPITKDLRREVAAHASQLFVVHESTVNQGLAKTLNCLIELLTDEVFVFRMDSDDISLPQRYQSQLQYLVDHPDVDILGTAITEVDSSTGEERLVQYCSGPEDARSNIHRRVPVAHPTVCFRRHVLQTVKGYPAVGTNEDVALWFECLRRGMVFDNLQASLLRFRISPAFWRRRSIGKAKSELLCYLRGVHSLEGYRTTKFLYPLARFFVRLAPTAVAKWAYRSSLRPGAITSRTQRPI